MANSLRMDRSSRRKPFIFVLFPLILLAAAVVVLFLLFEREKPVVDIADEPHLIGTQQQLSFSVEDRKSGIRHLDVTVRQGNKLKTVHEQNFQRQGYFSKAGPNHLEANVNIDTGRMGLKDGEADIIVTARDFSFWNLLQGNTTERIYPVVLDTKPPQINRMDSPRYIQPGGAGMVVYRISEMVARHGVSINDFFHPGFPMPGKSDLFGAMIAIPYDAAKIKDAHVVAVDEAGNVGKAPFGMILKKANFKNDRINVPESFLELKIPEFSQHYPEMTGSMLDKYLYVNNKVRQANNQRIMQVCRNSLPEQLWQGRFLRMEGSSTRAGFADHRTYYYDGKEVDKQVHLGIDLASVRHDQVEAANKGKVVFADYLGIYGNTVILDHGLGIFSLYSHLSGIDAAKGDILEKGAKLGTSGMSGMAGGDHLHFSMLVNGVFVTPLEWWDESWLDLHVQSYLK